MGAGSKAIKKVDAPHGGGRLSLIGLEQGFPMYVVRMRDVLQMERVLSHGELLVAGMLVEYLDGMGNVLFVSHQWLGCKTPDPQFKQFRVLQAALRNIIGGEVLVQNGTSMQVMGLGKGAMPIKFARSLQEAFIWYDFFGIPQWCDYEDEATSLEIAHTSSDHRVAPPDGMLDAINSLPCYVHRSRMFVILVPPCLHVGFDTCCDFSTWLKRGWCNLEFMSSAMCPSKQDRLLIRAEKDMEFTSALTAFSFLPGEGVFTVESDRQAVASVVASLIKHKIDDLWPTQPSMALLFRACTPRLLDGLIPTKREVDSLESFARKYGCTSLPDGLALPGRSHGFRLLHYAAIEGRCDLAHELVSRHKVPVGSKAILVVPDFCDAKNVTPLIMAAMFGTASATDIVATLVELRADINEGDGDQGRPIHGALATRNIAMFRAVLEARADLECRSKLGWTALHVAAHQVPEVIETLLMAGARADVVDVFNGSPLQCLANCDATVPMLTQAVKLLLDAKANIDGQHSVTESRAWQCRHRIAARLVFCGSTNVILESLAVASGGGAAPLLSAVRANNPNAAMVFLNSGADPQTVRLGLSIVAWARRLGRSGHAWQPLLRMDVETEGQLDERPALSEADAIALRPLDAHALYTDDDTNFMRQISPMCMEADGDEEEHNVPTPSVGRRRPPEQLEPPRPPLVSHPSSTSYFSETSVGL